MTPTEKAIETRQRNKEMREAKRVAEKELTEKAVQICESILNDPNATKEEQLHAIALLIDLRKKW